MKKRRLTALLLCFVFVIAGAIEATPLRAIAQKSPSSQALGERQAPTRNVIGSTVATLRARAGAQASAETRSAAPAGARPLSDLQSGSVRTMAFQPSATDTFIEDFEGAWNDTSNPKNVWQLADYSGIYGGQYLWGKRQCYVYSPSWSAFAAGGGSKGANRTCVSNYPKNSNFWAIAGPLDFSQYASGTVTYYFRGDSEWSQTDPQACVDGVDDELFIGLGTDGSNFSGRVTCGNGNSQFFSDSFDLSQLTTEVLGQPFVYLGLAFNSDGDSNLGTGWSVDHIVLELVRKTTTGTTVFVPMVSKSEVPIQTPSCPGTEPANDASTGAGTITAFGQLCAGSLSNDTLDWYKFTATAGKQVTIDLSDVPIGADYDLYVFDSNKKDVARGINGAGQSERVTFTSTGNGLYYVRVSLAGTNAAPFSYKLRVGVS